MSNTLSHNALFHGGGTRKAGLVKQRPAGTLKAAQAQLVDLVGGLERAADIVGKGKSTVQRWTDSDEEGRGSHMPVDAVRQLELIAGRPIVTEFLAREAGHLLHRLEPAAYAASVEAMGVERGSAELAGEQAIFFQNLAAALADGRVDGREAGVLLESLDRHLTKTLALRETLAALRDEEE